MPAAAVPALIGGLVSAGQAISGASQLQKDKAELKRLTPAFYKVQDEYFRNERQAAGLAGQGMTAGAKDFYSDMAGAGLGASISAAFQGNTDPSVISKIFDSYNNSIRKVATDDAEMQINNIKYYQQVGKDLAGQKTQQWAINEYQPYQNKLKELTQRISADKQNIWNGVQGMIGAGQAAVTATQNEKLLQGLFGEKKKGIKDLVSGVTEEAGKGLFAGMNDPFEKKSSGVPTNGGFDEVTGVNFDKVGNMAKSMLNREEMSDWIKNLSKEDLAVMMEDIQGAFKAKE